jgi:demethylmenaquinone methyltransferase/2-methoxy-6-polyprenyl-1,4-benzoquinol methylase
MQPLSSSRPLSKYFDSDARRESFVRSLFDTCAPDYDRICRIAAFGQGQRYRRDALARAGLVAGMRVLDAATGTGLTASEAMALVGPAGRVVGVDPSSGMLLQAQRVGYSAAQGRGEALPFADASFDMVSMGYALRHLADLTVAFGEFRRVLRPSGRVVVLEITEPRSRIAAWLAKQYFQRVVPALTPNTTRPGNADDLMRYYWDTIHLCVEPAAILDALRDSGFEDVRRDVVHHVFSAYVGRRP